MRELQNEKAGYKPYMDESMCGPPCAAYGFECGWTLASVGFSMAELDNCRVKQGAGGPTKGGKKSSAKCECKKIVPRYLSLMTGDLKAANQQALHSILSKVRRRFVAVFVIDRADLFRLADLMLKATKSKVKKLVNLCVACMKLVNAIDSLFRVHCPSSLQNREQMVRLSLESDMMPLFYQRRFQNSKTL